MLVIYKLKLITTNTGWRVIYMEAIINTSEGCDYSKPIVNKNL